MENTKNVRITIAPQAIITILLSVLGLWLAYQLRDIIVLFIVVLAFTVALSPIVKVWEKFIPRTLAIIILYLLVIAIFVAIVGLFLPPLLTQLNDFISYLQHSITTNYGASDTLLDQIRTSVDLFTGVKGVQSITELIKQFQGSFGALFDTTISVIGAGIAIVTVFVSSFYLLMAERNFDLFLSTFLSDRHRKQVVSMTDKISQKIGDWMRGQLLLMLIIGVLDGIGIALIGIPYPLLLALWAGLCEAVPVVGPVLGAAPAIVLAYITFGWTRTLIALILYILVQQLENHILVPKIMGKVLGVSPVTIIFALLIGGKLAGFVGVVIAVPVAAVISVFMEEWRVGDQIKEKSKEA